MRSDLGPEASALLDVAEPLLAPLVSRVPFADLPRMVAVVVRVNGRVGVALNERDYFARGLRALGFERAISEIATRSGPGRICVVVPIGSRLELAEYLVKWASPGGNA